MSTKTHFLTTAAARTLSLRSIFQMSEDEAFKGFCKLRWADTDGEPACPRCGCLENYFIPKRRRFKCAACYHQYSPTAGTILASRKMSYVDLLAAICIFVNAVKGLSALQLCRDLDCQHKTAFVLAHKLREALASEYEKLVLSGEIEIDGAHFGGHIRPANKAEDRVDRRLAEHQTGTRRVVVAMRARKGRTRTFLVRDEHEGVALVPGVVAKGSTVHADEATHWDALHGHYETHRINHSVAYSLDGACTNQAESFFARLRRMVGGQHHHVSARYLHQYASEAAFKEDHRRLSNGALADRTLRLALSHKVSKNWKGYWQRAKVVS